MMAGEMMAGEMMAGEMMAGEMMAGEMMAGEMMAGDSPMPTVCEQYCQAYLNNCTDRAISKWGEDEATQETLCIEACTELEEGEVGATSGDTAACALTYAEQAAELGDMACLSAGITLDRPCFEYDASFEEMGTYSRLLNFGELSLIRFILNDSTLVRLAAIDEDYCIINDFRMKVYDLTNPLQPELLFTVDDSNTEELDYCPVWLGQLEAGTYEVEVGTYQEQGADDAFNFELSQPELLDQGSICVDYFDRPLSLCTDDYICDGGLCVNLLDEGELCQFNDLGELINPCSDRLFCYSVQTELAEAEGVCTVSPSEEGERCHPERSLCPINLSCLLVDEAFICQSAFCGDGIQNQDETCDDGNEIAGDGCTQTCQIETRREIATSAQSITSIGVLNQSSEMWARPSSRCETLNPQSPEYLYDTRVFTNLTGEPQVITILADWRDFDGFLHVYSGDIEANEIDLSQPLNSCLEGNDDGIAGTSESIIYDINLNIGETVTVVSSTFECCFIDPDFTGLYELTVLTHGCGDGYLQAPETCDDGNLINGDHCDSECNIELFCGDGQLGLNEECDDGNGLDGDGCSSLCEEEEVDSIIVEVPLPSQTTDPHGAILEDAPLWQRPGTPPDACASTDIGPYAFANYTLINQTGFDQVVDFDLIPESDFEDFYLHIYTHPFNPQDGIFSCITGADGGGDRFIDDRLEGFEIAAGETVSVIVSAYEAADPPFGYPGSFQLLISTQEPALVDACAFISPDTLSRVTGETFNATAVVSAEGYTTLSEGFDEPLHVDIGYGPIGVDPNDEEGVLNGEPQWIWHSTVPNMGWDDMDGEWSGYDQYTGTVTTPEAGVWQLAARASLVGQGWMYCDLGPIEGYQEDETGRLTAIESTPPRLLINEIDYDQQGGDINEFVELYNPGPAQINLDQVTISFFDGNSNLEYYTQSLSGTGLLEAGSYFVIGSPLVTDLLPPNTQFTNLGATLQNGGASADAVRLENAQGEIYDALSYEGAGEFIDGYTEGSGQSDGDDPSLSPNGTLSRCPNGVDTNQNDQDFILSNQATPGEANLCP